MTGMLRVCWKRAWGTLWEELQSDLSIQWHPHLGWILAISRHLLSVGEPPRIESPTYLWLNRLEFYLYSSKDIYTITASLKNELLPNDTKSVWDSWVEGLCHTYDEIEGWADDARSSMESLLSEFKASTDSTPPWDRRSRYHRQSIQSMLSSGEIKCKCG
jgi:hypothetical protein